jgi:nucleoside-triphosphatase THEP1
MVLVLSGPVHGGKTTFLERRLPRWAARGFVPRGFLSPAVVKAGRTEGYDLLEIATGRRRPYLRTAGQDPAAERIGPYAFVPEALERARAILREEAGTPGLLIVDEIGPLEMLGGGLWAALHMALEVRTGATLLVIREGLVAELAGRFEAVRPAVFDIRDPGVSDRLDQNLDREVRP